ncbi:hypothetical protein RB795 [Rhodopirellula baltica SH 1]|uniref:Uncharacterized protein n=1 Tax=Rhodopirellula baltica (strain DSM 10527 / NCIMB 13988 / SH1) TaxID=243090 RepID=Q7UY91_RHOBA|nr:hypothetical protein RB795 [Rhodopirellula baltica SH 1]
MNHRVANIPLFTQIGSLNVAELWRLLHHPRFSQQTIRLMRPIHQHRVTTTSASIRLHVLDRGGTILFRSGPHLPKKRSKNWTTASIWKSSE